MSNWESSRTINLETFQSLKILLENRAIKRLYDLKDIHALKMSSCLGINYSRYAEKLASPEKFSVFELLRFAYLIDVDPNIVMELIQSSQDVLSMIQTKVTADIGKVKPGVL